MEEPKKFKLFEWTTIIYAFLTFLGYSYVDSYYSSWGIEIYSFLDASEILLLFLNNANYLILVFLGWTSFFGIYLFYISMKGKPNVLIHSKPKWQKILYNVISLIGIAIFIYIIYLMYNWNKAITKSVVYLITFFTSYKIFGIIIPKSIEIKNIQYNPKYLQIILIILMVIEFNVLCSDFKYLGTSKHNDTIFGFNYESTTYNSNDSLLYIGATSKYIFLRNTKDSTNLIFDKGNIKNLSITEKH